LHDVYYKIYDVVAEDDLYTVSEGYFKLKKLKEEIIT
jgi:hypothetical protein